MLEHGFQLVFHLGQCIEDPVVEALFLEFFPEVFDGIEFRAVGWQGNQRDIVRNDSLFSPMAGCAIQDQNEVMVRITVGQLLEEQIEAVGAHVGQNQGDGLPIEWTGCRVGVGIFPNDLAWNNRSVSYRSPTPNDLTDASKAGFILKE